MKEIEITIDIDGKTEIDLKGYHGKGCSQITDEIVKGLSGDVVRRSQKCEFFKPKPKATVKQRQGS